MTGHRVKHKVAGFGERAHFKVPPIRCRRSSIPNGAKETSYGVIARSSEYLIVNGYTVYNSRTMRRRPQAEAYSRECIKDMRADHYEYIKRGSTTSTAEVTKGDGRPDIPKTSENKCQPRSVRIREEGIIRLGYTAGCPGCAWYSDVLGPHRGHLMECRTRIEEEMGGTEDGTPRVEIAETRRGRH